MAKTTTNGGHSAPNVQGEPNATNNTPKKKVKVDHVKNVNLMQCVFTIFGAILGLIIFLVPATFGKSFTFLFQHTPYISNEVEFDLTTTLTVMQGFSMLTKLSDEVIQYFITAYTYAPFVYVGILAADLLFALLLLITRSQILRIIFKILSIIFALAMFAIALLYIVYIVGFAGLIIHAIIKIEELLSALDSSGILVALAFALLGFIFTGKQLKWFAKLY